MITSTTNQFVKDLMKLKQKKYQDEYYLIEGYHLIEEALKYNLVECILSTEFYDCDVPFHLVNDVIINKLAFTKTSQPIIGKCKKQSHVINYSATRTLILDDVQDPGNLGTLIRSALSFGYEQVIISNHSVDVYNDKVLRSCQGANFRIPIIYEDIKQVIGMLQNNDVQVIASALEGGKDIEKIIPYDKLAIVVGNEGNGMKQEHIDLCDDIGYIPIVELDSLNVGVAGGIMMHYFKK